MSTLIWGKNPINNGKIIKKAEEISFKEEFAEVFCNQSIIIGKTKNNEIYKKGNFKFEKNNNEEFKLLKFVMTFSSVNTIEIGTNHCLFLMNNNELYSVGDNYYGQLGLDNYHIPMTSEPKKISIMGIKSITVYKDSNFAIDKNNRLFAWGANRYLGINSQSNLFKPKQIYLNIKISKIFVSDNKIVINTLNENMNHLQQEERRIETKNNKENQEIITNQVPISNKEIKTERSEYLSKEKNDLATIKTVNTNKLNKDLKSSEVLTDANNLMKYIQDINKFESKIISPISKFIPLTNK